MSTDISFWGEYDIRVDDGVSERLERLYGGFATDRAIDPSLELEAASIPAAEQALGLGSEYLGRSGETFVWHRSDGGIAVDGDWTRLAVEPGCHAFRLVWLVEWGLRRALVEEGYAMIHASAVRYDGETILFPARRRVGKTNTMLTYLERGADYLADDRLFVGSDGTARGFPTPVNLLPYNVRHFPELASHISNEQLFWLAEKIDALADAGSTDLHTILSFVNRKYLKDRTWQYRAAPEQLFERTDVVTESAADKVVLLRLNNARSTPSITEIESDQMSTTLDAINAYEWNDDLEELVRGHDALFPARESKRAQHRRLIRRERAVLEECCDSVPTYLLEVPGEEHWSEEVKEAIFREVASV